MSFASHFLKEVMGHLSFGGLLFASHWRRRAWGFACGLRVFSHLEKWTFEIERGGSFFVLRVSFEMEGGVFVSFCVESERCPILFSV